MSSKGNYSTAEYERRKTAISENNPKKPTRPLTAYHLFFQLEREYILQTTPATGDPNNDPARPQVDDRPIGKEIDPEMPHRYRCVRLSPHWHISGSGKRTGKEIKKRRHRKTHGKIGFLELSKKIAARWAGLEEKDRETKVYVTRIAGRELEAYRRAMKEYNKEKNANEMKFWIKHASGRLLDGMSTESAGEAVATATPPENIMGKATAASSSQSARPSLPWLVPEGNSMAYEPAESMPSPNYKATASINEAKSDKLKVDSIDTYEMKLWIKRASRMYLGDLAEKGPRRSSDPGIRSKLSFDSFEMPGSSAQALYSHGRREAMPPVPHERLRHSFTSASLFRRGGGGNFGQGNAHRGIGEMNYEMDAFPSREDQQRDRSQGRGCDFGSIAPIGHIPTSAFDDARGPCDARRGNDDSNKRDASLSRMDHWSGGGRGYGFGIGTSGATPIDHRPPSTFDNTLGPSGTESPPLGLEDAVGITSEDAMGLMKALSDSE